MRDEAGERPQERRLPRPGRTEERDDLPRLQAERDVLERRTGRARVAELEPFDLD
jgi:hypothetical protein